MFVNVNFTSCHGNTLKNRSVSLGYSQSWLSILFILLTNIISSITIQLPASIIIMSGITHH